MGRVPHRPPLNLFDNEVRLCSLDELTETVRLLECSQPGRAAAELSNAVFAELAMKRSRRAVELVAEAIRLARSREPREDIGGSGGRRVPRKCGPGRCAPVTRFPRTAQSPNTRSRPTTRHIRTAPTDALPMSASPLLTFRPRDKLTGEGLDA